MSAKYVPAFYLYDGIRILESPDVFSYRTAFRSEVMMLFLLHIAPCSSVDLQK